MNSESLEIFIISAMKSKTNKTGLTICYKDEKSSNYRKGFLILDVWFEGTNLFDKLMSEDFLGKQFDALYHYEPGFRGSAYMKVDDIFDNGVSILS